MKINSFQLILAFLSLAFTSCETDIEFSGRDTSTLLVLNSIITPDSLIKVKVSESRFFLDNDSKFNDVLNATVKIWVNGIEQPALLHKGNGLYVSSYMPKAGDKIKITAKNDKYKEVKSFTEVVPAIPVSSIDTSFKVADSLYGYNVDFSMKLHIKDPKEVDNYYRIIVKSVDNYSNGINSVAGVYFNSDDPVFGSTSEEGIFGGGFYGMYSVFSDALFNGKEYSLSMNTTLYNGGFVNGGSSKDENPFNNPYIVKREFVFELQSISKSYYLYLKSREAGSNVIGFFSEPVQIYNNIEGGIGIFANYNSSFYKIGIPTNMGNQYSY